ncbi:MAG: helix-turn-helix domain-containing protein [Oscillospiraceae bacterium]|jgi:IS30 family transposase|uniref:helix-turn-helix domain-containing protein n=1 Tax=Segatella sp. TaxID=2974253 RepID=UPI002EB4C8BF|nr:helix-turn-helix domain-containing protein [Oscillospiraceae bacterium]
MAKRTRVTQQEKEQMWQLYNQLGSYAKVAKKLHRSSDTVSRYVREHEAAVNAVRVVVDAQNT